MPFHVVVISVALLLHITIAKVYYVTTNDSDFISSNDTETADVNNLEYYLKNGTKYFSSDTQFHFKMGHHYLSTDLIIQNVTNVALSGESSCIIRCTSHVSIIVFNVTNFRLEHITVENCNTNYSSHIHFDFSRYHYTSIKKSGINASVLLYQCMSMKINNITVIITEGNTGMLIVNVRNSSMITNVNITVQTNCHTVINDTSLLTNGILLYSDNWKNKNGKSSEIHLDKFNFKANRSCSHLIYYAIVSLLFQNNTNVTVIIENTKFTDLINVSAVYYFGETCGISVKNHLTIRNCNVSNNFGNPSLKMFHVTLYNKNCIILYEIIQSYYLQQYTIIEFTNCKFKNNSNMTSMIYVSPASSRATTGYFRFTKISFHNNRNTHFLIMKSDADNLWQFSNNVVIKTMTITSNVHDEGHNLMSFINSRVWLNGPILIRNNCCFINIANFHLSINIFHYNIDIANNTVRQILSGTFIMLKQNTVINIIRNTVYTLLNQIHTYSMNSEPICTIQFYTELNIFDVTKFLTHVTMSNNTHMTSKYLPNYNFNCRWLAGNVFQKAGLQSEFVYAKVLQIENNSAIRKDMKRPISLSICKCINHSLPTGDDIDPDCYSSNLGSIFPGQTLKVKLMVKKQWLYHNSSTVNIVVHNTEDDDCSVVDAFELSQTHLNHACNNYSYTLWPKNKTIDACELFIGLQNMPEMFYVQLKPCPLGFTLQESRKSCYCDPVLANNEVIPIKSCNLDDETILRPAYSWMFAELDNNTDNITYVVSSYCPFEYCLPYQSYLKLSNPDSQCQHKRTGLLCGKCQAGLSCVFGSGHCKQCSNIYLLLVIPIITIAGIAFVTLLYAFDLTVRSGMVNTCIFYVNIININVVMIFQNCQSFTCMILSCMNFDFRFKSCFYNGMDDYAKAWLHLILPFYLIGIAIALIILSRYSARVQRLTARKALPVLATLFLFSYIKVLIIICNVLFRYSRVTHLPSNKTELVWSISTTTPLFGVKFLALFIICTILFLILLPFNLILLFTRTLSCLRFISMFKPILDTYFGPYKDNTYYWTGLLLLIRVIVYVLLAIDEGTSLIISVLFGGLLYLHATVQPFKNKFHNIQEGITILNLSAIHAALSYKNNSVGLAIAKVLITVGLIYFIIAIILHCITYRCNDKIHKGIQWLFSKLSKVKIINWICHNLLGCAPQALQADQNTELTSDEDDRYQEFQEPLLGLISDNI